MTDALLPIAEPQFTWRGAQYICHVTHCEVVPGALDVCVYQLLRGCIRYAGYGWIYHGTLRLSEMVSSMRHAVLQAVRNEVCSW